MMQNIILISLLIFLIFFMSNEEKINELISKKYVKYLFILLIVYFIYQNYNFTLLALALLILIFLNINIEEKFKNNIYLFNYDKIKKLVIDFYNDLNSKTKKELFSNEEVKNTEKYDFEPFNYNNSSNELNESNGLNNNDENNKKNIETEPFKNAISEIKDLYENIKLQINKLN